ncbi:MAG: hypothetical protein ABL956_09700 [Hyphomonadaceae bacterium]
MAAVFQGCAQPGPDDAELPEAQVETCRVWHNLIHSLNDGEPGFMPNEDGNAPEQILMTDLGRKIRYSIMAYASSASGGACQRQKFGRRRRKRNGAASLGPPPHDPM